MHSLIHRGNNALHIAVKEGHLEVVRVLLTESQIDAEAVNFKGRNPLHILANFGNDNAVAIFDLFLECMPDYPLDKTDADGSTGKILSKKKEMTFPMSNDDDPWEFQHYYSLT